MDYLILKGLCVKNYVKSINGNNFVQDNQNLSPADF